MERWTGSDRREAEEFLIAPDAGRAGDGQRVVLLCLVELLGAGRLLLFEIGMLDRLEDAGRTTGETGILALVCSMRSAAERVHEVMVNSGSGGSVHLPPV